MERAKKKVPDKLTDEIFEHIFRHGLGNVIILQSTPTKAQMKANTIGYYDNELFFKLSNGELKKFTVTDVS